MTLHKWAPVLMLLTWSCTAVSEDFFEMTDAEPSRTGQEAERNIEFSGALTHRLHYALTEQSDQLPFRREDTGPASIRYDLLLESRYRLGDDITFQLAGLGSYDAELVDPSYIELHQSYIEWGATPSLNLKVGRQLVSLGESNYFQIADRINPIDERAFGLAELRETLLPVASTRLSYYQSRWGLDLTAVHEFRPNQYDEPYGDFDPYIELRALPLHIQEHRPDVSFTDPDLVGRLFWSRPWGDLAVFASQIHSREARPLEAGSNDLVLGYSEITLLGASANRVLGDWLLKSEYAYSDGDLYLVDHSHAVETQGASALSVEGSEHQHMVGGRYSGMSNLTLDLELLGSRIGSTEAPLGEEKTQLKGVASLEYQMLNEDLVANLTYMGWTKNPASMVRFRLDYAFRDEIVLFIGAVNYRASSEDSMLAPYQNNDRIFTGFTLTF
ncbi:DUF1302 family protein [Marinimicrobium sp. ABcell2]|uniref:DUF1302 family protein n=1 Tax=Marinimicrobium sp. ABcell2 TaxID=3069751 RepID=UPI0027B092CE|nr:DUF1302 family protein [Marinimicrobium sp. ABcell2]MDQ2078412.1 hypothetical protein [Marinimicrobium sp. ABcell2]